MRLVSAGCLRFGSPRTASSHRPVVGPAVPSYASKEQQELMCGLPDEAAWCVIGLGIRAEQPLPTQTRSYAGPSGDPEIGHSEAWSTGAGVGGVITRIVKTRTLGRKLNEIRGFQVRCNVAQGSRAHKATPGDFQYRSGRR